MKRKNMNKKLLALHILDQILSLIGAGVALFWSAGRIDWWSAWAAIAVWLVWFMAMDIILLRTNPDLMAERLSPPRGAKGWDRAIVSILRLTQLVRYILAGLDQRYGWTGGFPVAVQITGLTACVLG
ncbi:MAG: hypothetical protein WCF08_04170 [Anaerolineaceae bacterium]